MSHPQNTLDFFLKRFWWVILFTLLCFFLFEQKVKNINSAYETLNQQLINLEEKLFLAKQRNQTLIQELQSCNDPEWIELKLKQVLGVVREGETKVIFTGKSPT